MEAGRDERSTNVCRAAIKTHLCFSLLSEQKRNTSLTYSNSLRALLQRKISALEEQLHPGNAALGEDHGEGKEHHDDSDGHRSDQHESDHTQGSDGANPAGHEDQRQHQEHQEEDGEHGNEAEGHALVSHAAYGALEKSGFHSAKLDSMLNQLHLAGTRTHTFTTDTYSII